MHTWFSKLHDDIEHQVCIYDLPVLFHFLWPGCPFTYLKATSNLHPSLPVYTLLDIKGMINLNIKRSSWRLCLDVWIPNFEYLKEKK